MRAGRVFGSMMVAVMVVSSVVVGQAAAAPVGTDDTVTVGEAAAALADVASVTGPSAVTVASSEGFTAAAAGSVVELPKDPTDGLSLTAASGVSIEVGLPGATTADDGVRQVSGQVVYADALPDVAVSAQPTLDGGVRALVIIDGPQAPTEFEFPMALPVGASLVPSADGGVAIIAADGTLMAQITAPWAYDANGAAVETSYRLAGSRLIQMVAHGGAAYPVVADPNWSLKWDRVTAYFTKAETQTIMSMGWGVAGGTGICGMIGAALGGGVGTPILAGMCLLQFGAIVYQAGVAFYSKKCLKIARFHWEGFLRPGSYTRGTCSW